MSAAADCGTPGPEGLPAICLVSTLDGFETSEPCSGILYLADPAGDRRVLCSAHLAWYRRGRGPVSVVVLLPDSSSTAGEGGSPSRLDDATKLVEDSGPWRVLVYEGAGEVVAVKEVPTPPDGLVGLLPEGPEQGRLDAPGTALGDVLDAEAAGEVEARNVLRSVTEAERRARAKLRRYCVRNKLNRLVTLTYAGAGCHDEDQVMKDAGRFVKALRLLLGVDRLAYAVVRELHPGGHGYHLHMAVSRYVPKGVLERAWGHGFVDVRKITANGQRAQARNAARYLAKYVGKTARIDAGRNVSRGKHRYEVAQGFAVRVVEFAVCTLAEARRVAVSTEGDGRSPSWEWSSLAVGEDWPGPPVAVWVF